jgi:hypothetical protein
VLGALVKVYGHGKNHVQRDRIRELLPWDPADTATQISRFNDSAEHGEVVELLKKADV